jgi:hypothetical protein
MDLMAEVAHFLPPSLAPGGDRCSSVSGRQNAGKMDGAHAESLEIVL